jgi:hypothetical protein
MGKRMDFISFSAFCPAELKSASDTSEDSSGVMKKSLTASDVGLSVVAADKERPYLYPERRRTARWPILKAEVLLNAAINSIVQYIGIVFIADGRKTGLIEM